MSRIRVTKIKSTIEKDRRQKDTMKALGLNKVGASREFQLNDAIQGMLRKVNHLVKVENI
jgi:large subunit ribosomal protein L30